VGAYRADVWQSWTLSKLTEQEAEGVEMEGRGCQAGKGSGHNAPSYQQKSQPPCSRRPDSPQTQSTRRIAPGGTSTTPRCPSPCFGDTQTVTTYDNATLPAKMYTRLQCPETLVSMDVSSVQIALCHAPAWFSVMHPSNWVICTSAVILFRDEAEILSEIPPWKVGQALREEVGRTWPIRPVRRPAVRGSGTPCSPQRKHRCRIHTSSHQSGGRHLAEELHMPAGTFDGLRSWFLRLASLSTNASASLYSAVVRQSEFPCCMAPPALLSESRLAMTEFRRWREK